MKNRAYYFHFPTVFLYYLEGSILLKVKIRVRRDPDARAERNTAHEAGRCCLPPSCRRWNEKYVSMYSPLYPTDAHSATDGAAWHQQHTYTSLLACLPACPPDPDPMSCGHAMPWDGWLPNGGGMEWPDGWRGLTPSIPPRRMGSERLGRTTCSFLVLRLGPVGRTAVTERTDVILWRPFLSVPVHTIHVLSIHRPQDGGIESAGKGTNRV